MLDWRFASEAPLPALLRHVDAHLTVTWSTVVKDASAEGVPSVACSGQAAESFPEELQSGMLVIAGTRDGILAALTTQLGRRRRPPKQNGDRATEAVRFLQSRQHAS